MADNTLPSADSLSDNLLQESSQKPGGSLPDASSMADNLLSNPKPPAVPTFSGGFADYFFGASSLGKVLTQYGQGAVNDWGSKPLGLSDESADYLRKNGTFNDYQKGQDSTLKAYNEAWIRGTAWLGDLATRSLSSTLLGGPSNVLEKTGGEMQDTAHKIEGVSPLAASVVGGTGQMLQASTEGFLPEVPFHGVPEADAYLDTATKARAAGKIGEGEQGFFNTKQVSPENLQARTEAAEETGIPVPTVEEPVTDVHQVARLIDPDSFKEYDERLQYHDELTSRLESLQPQESFEGQPTFLGGKSEELLKAEEDYKDNYNRLSELQPAIEDAYKHANDLIPEMERYGDKEPENTQVNDGEGEKQEPTTAPQKPTQADETSGSTHIADTVKQQLMDSGRPEEEADATGWLAQARYQARSKAFGGKRGTAEDLFNQDFPTIEKTSENAPKEVGKTLNQSEAKPTFYSSLGRGLDKINAKSAPPEQWSKTIDNLTGVKKEEVEWSGVKDWLREQKGQVSKTDVQKYLDENNVQVKEVEKRTPTADDLDDNLHLLKDLATVFPSVRLPGGEDYRELLLTLPEKEGAVKGPKGWGDTAGGTSDSKNFIGGHWSEPNVLSHIRFDTRTGPNGEKILHVAEVQSDWHQKGRKEGYKTEETGPSLQDLREKVEYMRPEVDEMLKRHDLLGFDSLGQALTSITHHPEDWDFDTPEDKALAKEYSDARNAVREAQDTTKPGVPDAPFKQTWQELSMKRMIRYAAENGFDKLSWDTGETNALRARQLLRNVKEVSWHPDTKVLHVILNSDAEGADRSPLRSLGVVPEDKLGTYLGKDGAAELLSSEKNDAGEHTLAKDNLTVGGKGNRKFYDEMLPTFMNKYVKKWGSSVQHDTVPLENRNEPGNIDIPTAPVHSVDITPQMKDSVMGEGQPLFQNKNRGSITLKNDRNVIRLFKDADASTAVHELGHQWLEEMTADASHPDAPDALKLDNQVVRDWLGAKKDEPLSVAQHEQFARGFERYLREGKAPSAGLQSVFEKFKDWLTQIYKTVKNLRSPISDDIRGVFDRLLSTPDEEGVSSETQSAKELDVQNSQTPSTSGQGMPLVQGTGENRVAGFAQQLEDDARASGLADSLGKLPESKILDQKEMWVKSADLAVNDYDRAKRIALQQEIAPEGTTFISVAKALSKEAMSRGDLDTIRTLANSGTAMRIREVGQLLKSAATEDDYSDPVTAIEAVQNAREKAMTKRLKGKDLDAERAKMAADIQSNMRELKPSDFESFIKSIECDY